MALQVFNSSPFVSINQIVPVDTFIGDGATTTFFLVNKTASQVGSTVTVNNVQYFLYNGGFSINLTNNSITLPTAPAIGASVIVPGNTAVVASVFDQAIVPGVSNPLVTQVPLYLSDNSTINLNSYSNLPAQAGIAISMVNLISSYAGALPSWCQFASSDINGNALTFGATGGTYFGPSITAIGSVTSSIVAGATAIPVTNSASFNANGYAAINFGNTTAEYVHVVRTDSQYIYLGGSTNYPHTAGETVYDNGYKFWLQITSPLNSCGGQATNLYNLGLAVNGSISARS